MAINRKPAPVVDLHSALLDLARDIPRAFAQFDEARKLFREVSDDVKFRDSALAAVKQTRAVLNSRADEVERIARQAPPDVMAGLLDASVRLKNLDRDVGWDLAHAAARLLPTTSNNLPEVDQKLNQIRHNGVCYDVTGDGALLMDKLVKAAVDPGRDWLPASKHFSKPSEVLNSLPAPLKALIETKQGKGYRLKPLKSR